MSNIVGVTTVTVAPIGAFSAITDLTFSINSVLALSRSLLMIITFTVPGPFHNGITLTKNTPLTNRAHCS